MRRHRIPSLVALCFLLVVLYAPLFRIVVNAFNANELATNWKGGTLRWFRAALGNDEVKSSIWVSAKLAVLTSIISVLVGTLAVVGLRALCSGERRVVRVGAAARVATPEIIFATALYVSVPLLGLRFGFITMLIGHTVYLTGFVIILISARASQADPKLEEAAQDLGARPWRVLFTIVLPDLAPAVGAAFLLSAAFSFDDVALSRTMGSPQTTTLPLVLVSLVQRRVTPEIDAIATILLAVGALLFAGALLLAGNILSLTGQPPSTEP